MREIIKGYPSYTNKKLWGKIKKVMGVAIPG